MNCPVHLHFRLIPHFFLLDLFICNHYDNNIFLLSNFKQRFLLWLENLILIKNSLKLPKMPCNRPVTCMNSEKLRVFFCQPYLVLIWSLQGWPLAAPKQASAVYRLSSVPTAAEHRFPKKSEADGIVKTSLLSRKPNCLNTFSKNSRKAKPWQSQKSTKPMKKKSEKKSRLPPSIACWHAMGGNPRAEILQRIRIDCNCHKCSTQILSFHRCGPARSIRLGDDRSECSKLCSCRSYPCASGDDC